MRIVQHLPRALPIVLLAHALPTRARADAYDWDLPTSEEPQVPAPASPPVEKAPAPRSATIDVEAPEGARSELRIGARVVARCDASCRWVVPLGVYRLDVDGDGIAHARHTTRVRGDLRVRITPGSPTEKTIGRATWIVGGVAVAAGVMLIGLSGMCALGENGCDAEADRNARSAQTIGGVVAGVGLAFTVVGLVLDFDGRTGIDVAPRTGAATSARGPRLAIAPSRDGAMGFATFVF